MSYSNREILVTGVTGLQGGTVVRHLRKRGYRLRALCRNPESAAARAVADKGVRIFQGDLEDRASLDAAVKGVFGVFSVQNYWDGFPARKLGREGEARQGINLLDAAKAAGVQHFVQSSGAGVTTAPELDVNAGKLAVESHGRAIGIPLTIIREVFFMESFTNPVWGLRGAILDGRLDLPVAPQTRLQMLAVDDLGHFVGMAFERPDDFVGAIFDLAGDQRTMVEIAETFTRVMGRPVRFSGSPEGVAQLREFDVDLADMFRVQLYERGFQAFIPALRALHPQMHTLEAYLRRAGWADGSPTLAFPD
jgi:uncharacterized protein YbjT (DUF2867 family)